LYSYSLVELPVQYTTYTVSVLDTGDTETEILETTSVTTGEEIDITTNIQLRYVIGEPV